MANRTVANELWVEQLGVKGCSWLSVLTGSMAPLIRPHDRVLVTRVETSKIRSGDIVAFRRFDNIIVHRVLHAQRYGGSIHFQEKGDARYFSRPVRGEDIIGRVTTLKKGEKVIHFNTPPGRFASLCYGVWSDITVKTISPFRSSSHRPMRLFGTLLERLFLLFSNVIIVPCLLVWSTFRPSSENNTR